MERRDLMSYVINSISHIRETELYKSNLLGKNDKEKTAVISNVLNSIDNKYLNRVYCNEKGAHGTFIFNERDFYDRKILIRGEGGFSELVSIIDKMSYSRNCEPSVRITPETHFTAGIYSYVETIPYDITWLERLNLIKLLDTLPAEAWVRKWALYNAICNSLVIRSNYCRQEIIKAVEGMFTGTDLCDRQFDFIIEHWFARIAPGCKPSKETFRFVNRVKNYEIVDVT